MAGEAVEARRAALRNAVLDAAERLVAEAGLSALSIREVAGEAGCAVGMVYKLFADHDALVLAVNGRTLDALDAALAASLAGAATPRDAMLRLAEGYGDYAAAHAPRWDALFTHRMGGGAALPPWYERKRDALFARLGGVLAGMSAAAPGGLDPALLSRTVFAAVHGVVALGLEQKLAPMPPEALRHSLRVLVGLVADGMAAA